jgi:hypothetical protein
MAETAKAVSASTAWSKHKQFGPALTFEATLPNSDHYGGLCQLSYP